MTFKVPDHVYPWIKESVFRDYFLPKFVEGNRDIFQEWIEKVAINIRAKVRVVEDNNIDNVLFVVPPMFNGIDDVGSGEISGVLSQYQRYLQAGYSERQADGLLKKTIQGTYKEGTVKDADIEAWRDILVRYKYDVSTDASQPKDTGLIYEEADFD